MTTVRASQQAQINITPMIDILLVLLIMFMVISPLSKGLDTQIPAKETSNLTEQEPLVISVGEHSRVSVNQHDVITIDSLGTALSEILRTRRDRTVLVQADADLTFQNVAAVIDIAKGSGASRVGLVASSP